MSVRIKFKNGSEMQDPDVLPDVKSSEVQAYQAMKRGVGMMFGSTQISPPVALVNPTPVVDPATPFKLRGK